jgi:protein-disulfide isomerase
MKFFLKPFAIVAFVALSLAAHAADTSSLKPPPGARVAIVVFEDLECPTCARVYPQVWQVASANNVAVVLHDFPLLQHPWSFDAAVFARFFDTKSEKLGNDFRGYIYSNQPSITKANLRQYVEKFANDNKTPLPFAIDPEGKLKEKVIADRDLGNRLGLTGTPTIYVVGNGGAATPPVQVTDYDKLSQTVEDMLQKSPAPKAAGKPGATKKKAAKKT